MKITLSATLSVVLLSFSLVLIVAGLILPARAAAASDEKAVTVDYVLALLDAGVDPAKIIERIEKRGLTFRLAPGDMDRLRAAGAEDTLIDAVIDHAAVLEGQGGAGSKAGQGQSPAQDTDRWGRPSRLTNPGGTGAAQSPASPDQEQATPAPGSEEQEYDQQSDGNDQGIEEEPYGGSYGYYPGYYPGYYDFYYGYPYPYYYYPYSAYFYYPYYPRRFFHGGTVSGGGGFRTAPRGGHMSVPRSAPRSGGGSHSAPRSSPRGSHH